MKNLVGRAAWDEENAKAGDNVQDQWRLSISAAIQCVELKVDFLILRLGFQFPPSPPSGETKPDLIGTSHGGGKDLSYILL